MFEIFRKLIQRDFDEFGGQPYLVCLPDGVFQARCYSILYSPDMTEYGVRFELPDQTVIDYHGSGFMIIFNPEFNFGKLFNNDCVPKPKSDRDLNYN